MRNVRVVASNVLVVFVLGTAAGQVPQVISHQGKLLNSAGQPVPDGAVAMEFRFYDACSGGNVLLTDTHTAVQMKDGIYSVLLGGGVLTPGIETSLGGVFANHSGVCLGTKVGADSEMQPRQQIASVAYALSAQQAVSAGPQGSLVFSDVFDSWNANWDTCGAVSLVNGAMQLSQPGGPPTTNCSDPSSSKARLVAPGASLRYGAVQFDFNNGGYNDFLNNAFVIGFSQYSVHLGGRNANGQAVVFYGPTGLLLQTPSPTLAPGRYEFSIVGSVIRFRNVTGGTPIDTQVTDSAAAGPAPLVIWVNEETATVDNLVLTRQ